MDEKVIPCVREMNDFHREVKEISAFGTYQNNALKNARKLLLQKVKQSQEMRCLTSLRYGYYMKMSAFNVTQFANLPFMLPEGIDVSERLVEMSGLGSQRSDITRLIKEIYAKRDELPDVFAQITTDDLGDEPPFLPEGAKAREFLAYSTFPALFGHCWTVELQRAFIQFITEICQRLPKSVFENLREHWLIDVIKSYVRNSEISLFLQLSIGDVILELIRDEELIKDVARPGMMGEVFGRIGEYAQQMIENMQKNLSVFPADVKWLIKGFVDTAENEEEKCDRIEVVFLDGILVPAISNPKAYSILPATYYHEMGSSGPGRTLGILAQAFRYIRHPGKLHARYSVDGTSIESLPLQSFLLELTNVEENELMGPKLVDLLPLLGIHFIIMLFSLPDIYLLASILQKSKVESLRKAASALQTDKPCPFKFFRSEEWEFKVFRMTKPPIPEIEVEKPAKIPSAATAEMLYKFLSFSEVDKMAPGDYDSFTFYHEDNMIRQQEYITEAYLRNLYVLWMKLSENERHQVLPALEDEIRRQQRFIEQNQDILTKISVQLKILTEDNDKAVSKMEDGKPVLYNYLMALFLQNNPSLVAEMKTRKEDLLLHNLLFKGFFENCVKKIKLFIGGIAEYAVEGVARQFHSFCMQELSLKEYQRLHLTYERCDRLLIGIADKCVETICISVAPVKIRNLFNYPSLFGFSLLALRKGVFLALPLETLNQIGLSIDLLNEMYKLEVGGTPQTEELAPMFSYAMLSSNVDNLFSMGKYLDHFLGTLVHCEVKLLDDRLRVTLAHFLNHISMLEPLLSEY